MPEPVLAVFQPVFLYSQVILPVRGIGHFILNIIQYTIHASSVVGSGHGQICSTMTEDIKDIVT